MGKRNPGNGTAKAPNQSTSRRRYGYGLRQVDTVELGGKPVPVMRAQHDAPGIAYAKHPITGALHKVRVTEAPEPEERVADITVPAPGEPA